MYSWLCFTILNCCNIFALAQFPNNGPVAMPYPLLNYPNTQFPNLGHTNGWPPMNMVPVNPILIFNMPTQVPSECNGRIEVSPYGGRATPKDYKTRLRPLEYVTPPDYNNEVSECKNDASEETSGSTFTVDDKNYPYKAVMSENTLEESDETQPSEPIPLSPFEGGTFKSVPGKEHHSKSKFSQKCGSTTGNTPIHEESDQHLSPSSPNKGNLYETTAEEGGQSYSHKHTSPSTSENDESENDFNGEREQIFEPSGSDISGEKEDLSKMTSDGGREGYKGNGDDMYKNDVSEGTPSSVIGTNDEYETAFYSDLHEMTPGGSSTEYPHKSSTSSSTSDSAEYETAFNGDREQAFESNEPHTMNFLPDRYENQRSEPIPARTSDEYETAFNNERKQGEVDDTLTSGENEENISHTKKGVIYDNEDSISAKPSEEHISKSVQHEASKENSHKPQGYIASGYQDEGDDFKSTSADKEAYYEEPTVSSSITDQDFISTAKSEEQRNNQGQRQGQDEGDDQSVGYGNQEQGNKYKSKSTTKKSSFEGPTEVSSLSDDESEDYGNQEQGNKYTSKSTTKESSYKGPTKVLSHDRNVHHNQGQSKNFISKSTHRDTSYQAPTEGFSVSDDESGDYGNQEQGNKYKPKSTTKESSYEGPTEVLSLSDDESGNYGNQEQGNKYKSKSTTKESSYEGPTEDFSLSDYESGDYGNREQGNKYKPKSTTKESSYEGPTEVFSLSDDESEDYGNQVQGNKYKSKSTTKESSYEGPTEVLSLSDDENGDYGNQDQSSSFISKSANGETSYQGSTQDFSLSDDQSMGYGNKEQGNKYKSKSTTKESSYEGPTEVFALSDSNGGDTAINEKHYQRKPKVTTLHSGKMHKTSVKNGKHGHWSKSGGYRHRQHYTRHNYGTTKYGSHNGYQTGGNRFKSSFGSKSRFNSTNQRRSMETSRSSDSEKVRNFEIPEKYRHAGFVSNSTIRRFHTQPRFIKISRSNSLTSRTGTNKQ